MSTGTLEEKKFLYRFVSTSSYSFLTNMTHRGRGALEIKPSPNPFFQQTSADIGIKISADDPIQWKVSGKAPPFNSKGHEVDGNFSFLYTRQVDIFVIDI